MKKDDPYEWWIRSAAHGDQSMTWYNTAWFDFFISIQSTDFSYISSGYSRPDDVSSFQRGDIIVLDLQDTNGNPGSDGYVDHIRLVTGWGYISPFSWDYSGQDGDKSGLIEYSLLISQHSNPRWHVNWDYNLWNIYDYTWGFMHRNQ